ncbi:MAG: hypothetical protein KIH69_023770, partial [Anaerolineae bacterium]|nr:hypothetical protein [Anaerolineae bacterium]
PTPTANPPTAPPAPPPPPHPPPHEPPVRRSTSPTGNLHEGESGQLRFSFASPNPGSDLGNVVIEIDLPAALLRSQTNHADGARLPPLLPFEVQSASYKVYHHSAQSGGSCVWLVDTARVRCAIGNVVVPYRVEVAITLNALRQGNYTVQARMLVDDAQRVVAGGAVTAHVTILARPSATPTPSAGQRRVFVPMVLVLRASRSLAD